jgi:pyruvate,water dikinase
MTPAAPAYVVPLSSVTLADIARVGGKNASLGELLRALGGQGVRVPQGFVLTADAFRLHLREAGLTEWIDRTLAQVDIRDVRALAEAGQAVRARVREAPLPAVLIPAVTEAYAELSRRSGEVATDVAVRSSATAEDLPGASFAGQHETYLNIRGLPALDVAIRACFASLFTDRAIVYRTSKGFAHSQVALSVGVQKMVRSDLGSAGVIFTLDTESGFRDVVLITGAWGIAESLVQGRVAPDEFWVHKPTLRAGFRSILRRDCGTKAVKLVYAEGLRAVREVPVPVADRRRFVLTDDEVLTLARWALAIEEHYSRVAGRPTPMDIEWARDGRSGELYIVQARPETVHAGRTGARLELFHRKGTGRVLLSGKSVGQRVGSGPVRLVHGTGELPQVQAGDVLVTRMTDPDWEPVLQRVAAVVTEEGGRTCHAAIVSRELGIPCVVGTGSAMTALSDGQVVTVSCAEGEEGRVYEGLVEFTREEIDPATTPRSPVPLLLNVANPDHAFALAQLPAAGVGLLRIEFVISGWIGIHPMAVAHPDRISDAETRARIADRCAGYASPAEFFIERLASGVGQIAGAFYPRPVIVRFSDFKTNEYAHLLGGAGFEPNESNPMIGFRGASRYYDDRYRDGFALECAAIRRVREVMGLTNLKLMIPFCRTLGEARLVLAELERNGLRRGVDGLEIYVMCEIPNNVILAAEFAELFDGFSIGSNDLTQLALGIDRDSELLAPLFDERDPGVKRLIAMVVKAAHEAGRPVGICGQAPSDYPEFAEYLAGLGIDSMSLNPDALIGVAERLSRTADAQAARPPLRLTGVRPLPVPG